MSAAILSYPFRVGLDGDVAKVDQESDTAHAEQIAVLALTRTGERELRPGFGIADPVFHELNVAELAAKIAIYGPPVDVDSIEAVPVSDTAQQVTVHFADAS